MDHAPYAGDVDVFGKLVLDPVPKYQDGINPDEQAIGDPSLVVIGEFIRAVMVARLSDAWSDINKPSIGGGTPVVKTISYNNPEDNTFNSKDLPGLYVFMPRDKPDKHERYADCQFWRIRYVTVLWIPPQRDQVQRADRSPFFNAVSSAVRGALCLDRFPGYVIEGDTDPYAATWGSSLMINAGLSKEVAADDDIEFNVVDVKIDMPKVPGSKDGTWEGARFNLRIYEDLDVSMTRRNAYAPPKLDATITENPDRTVEQFGYVSETAGIPT